MVRQKSDLATALYENDEKSLIIRVILQRIDE